MHVLTCRLQYTAYGGGLFKNVRLLVSNTTTYTDEVLWRRQCREKLKARAHDMEKSPLKKCVPLLKAAHGDQRHGTYNKFYIII